jgi:hypothetical protein
MSTLVPLFIGWVLYVITTQYNASLAFLAVSWLVWIVLAGGSLLVCISVIISEIALRRQGSVPVISFETDHVTYRTDTRATVTIPLSEIQGVEVVREYRSVSILIYRPNSHKDKIPITVLNASSTEVFLAFKERLPHLLQPYSTVERLILSA